MNMKKEQNNVSRKYNLDMARCYACILVVLIHVVSIDWYIDPHLGKWKIYNIFDTFARCGVPIFFMLSGILFLEREVFQIRKFFTHNIFRLLKIWIAWTILYEGYSQIRFHTYSGVKEFILACINGHYHLWFLPMMIMVYLLFPIVHAGLHKHTVDLKCMVGLFALLILRANIFLIPNRSDIVNALLNKADFATAIIYTGYAVLGYYLSLKRFGNRARILCCVGYVSISIVSALGNDWYSISCNNGIASEWLYSYFSIFTCLQAICVLCFFLSLKNSSEKGKIWKYISSCTLGVYLIHPFIVEELAYKGVSVASVHPLISIPVILGITTGGSLGIVWIIKKIPIVNKLV